jgi:hypothetical protein
MLTSTGLTRKVALLCTQERLRALLQLSLQAADHEVVVWSHLTAPDQPNVDAVVVDLDSLGQNVPDVLDLLGAWGVGESTALLFISVYPLDLRTLHWTGPYDALQPPFAPVSFSDRVRRLLRRGAPPPVPGCRDGRRMSGDGGETATCAGS